jgi:OOP family OmpA-OmpF porin
MDDRATRRLAALTALVICVAGCGDLGLTGGGGGGSTAACPWLDQAAQAAQQPADIQSDTVVLIDISASFWPKTGGSVLMPADPAAVATSGLLTDFGGAGTRLVSLGTFDGSSSTINWQFGDVALPTAYGSMQNVQAQQQAAGRCLTGAVESALGGEPQLPGTDVMAALAAAGQQLQGTQAARDHVVLITDGLSNAGCLNLSNVISRGQSAAAVLAACPEHAGLSALRGVHVRLLDIGFQAAYPPLSSAEQAWVENYWQTMCVALGVASPAQCLAPAERDTTRTSAVTRPADPPITFPAVPRTAPALTVPADLLFAFNSATLSAAGQSYLDILIQEIKAQGRTITEVIGHTDAVGTVNYNLLLSKRRATAVQAYLAARGFTRVEAAGVGEADPACSPQYTPAGAAIESCMAQDRRVQIVLGG